jgi:UDP-N-acetylmuramoylalanine--D-glutamate ligase
MQLKKDIKEIQGLRVTIMGLGLHGGGIEAALFFARNGARVTVTDLKDESSLVSSVAKLSEYPIRFVLGRHESSDFVDTDLVVKNPGVPPTSKYIEISKSYGVPVETDISVFLKLTKNPIIAVTGSKGKSTLSSAIHFCLKEKYPDAMIGGNITISPLSFMNLMQPSTPVVLELSSWQLADLKGNADFKPKVSLITNIFPDHMNWYKNMEDYTNDKKIIFMNQDIQDYSIFNFDDERLSGLHAESKARTFYFSAHPLPDDVVGAFLDGDEGFMRIGKKRLCLFGSSVKLIGFHNRLNLLGAGLACALFGEEPGLIRERLERFPGIEHRLELFLERDGISFYNDSAATIPHATAAAISSINAPIYLITGGTDKNIDFAPLFEVSRIPRNIYLLAGSATEKIEQGLKERGIRYQGPFGSLEDAVKKVVEDVQKGSIVLFSPACASFGMFANEFDRGRKYKACVLSQFKSSPDD